ncbi:MAG TPA: MaoC/PaaZ C-terminal domain-containing protein [Bryobacteraceae bacterium]|nr:MaoC/PaaZ C-terminal domain-containing protein [Bryobacteraceae bacterium]
MERLPAYSDLEVGMTREKEYVISPAVYEAFLGLFGDASPLHVGDAYAIKCGFKGALMHGAILNGFISNFIGMVFPGGKALELSVDIRFQRPCYLADTIRIEGKIAQKLDAHNVAVVHLTFHNRTSGEVAATARVQVKMMTEEILG